MKPIKLATASLITGSLFALSAYAEPSPLIRGSYDHMVCLNSGTIKVRDESLKKVLFSAENFEQLKLFQTDKKTKKLGSTKYTFIKVQFPYRDEGKDIAWIPEQFVKSGADCRQKISEEKEEVREVSTNISGLNDKECCEFPTIKPVTHTFTSAQRAFGARRSKGRRVHAACDLYRVKNEAAVSVAPGTVIRNPYKFYQGTFAVEVKHSGGFIVRYGELTGKRASGISGGKAVKAGQTVGYIGKVNSGCCNPMLHFELYSGAAKGALSQKGNKYQRRRDLMNPTSYLLKWYDNKFKIRK
ncbi:MAG: M23 family metallopeptidase [Oligoflexia bacterium]|nr:M23 family metallopeptidase [Oligoflexia bacterium]